MTIAAGFTANDGIILCADMQQTMGQIKTYDGKVDLYVFSNCVAAILGTGHVDYIRTAKDDIVKGLPKYKTLAEVEHGLEETLLKFFDDHLARWSSFPEYERPSVELLIGVSGKRFPSALFHYQGTSFSRTYQKAIGAGVLLADELIGRYCHLRDYTITELASLAIYILSKVKYGVDSCGGPTDIVGLRSGGDFALTEMSQIKQLEEEFLEMERKENGTFAEALANKKLPFSWHSEHSRKKAVKQVSNVNPTSSSAP